jgi:hypothetical protein
MTNGMGLEKHCSDGLATCWVAEKLATLTGETMKVSGAKSSLQRGILLTNICETWLYEVNEGIDRNGCYKIVYALSSISRKFPNMVSQRLQESLSVEQHWCGKRQISIHPQVSAPESIPYVMKSLRNLQGH